jgi:hypothetical protein
MNSGCWVPGKTYTANTELPIQVIHLEAFLFGIFLAFGKYEATLGEFGLRQ